MPHYWIVVAAENHALRGIAGGFVQANHGKASPLKRMRGGDGILIYSPTLVFGGKDRLQAFTGIGYVLEGDAYQVDTGDGFAPFRKAVAWQAARAASIRPLLEKLSFTQGSSNWGQKFRFGLFEIAVADFEIIRQAMVA